MTDPIKMIRLLQSGRSESQTKIQELVSMTKDIQAVSVKAKIEAILSERPSKFLPSAMCN